MFSRRNTRIALIQALYADIFIQNVDISAFRESYIDENPVRNIDEVFFVHHRDFVHQNMAKFLAIIVDLAPKFEIEKMPRLHIIILALALAEIYSDSDVDDKVSINEAIELAKHFSDASGAKFINGILGNFIRNREKYDTIEPSSYQFFI